MAALYEALGPEKGAAFLKLVASGALDGRLLSPVTAWARQNPELVQAGATAIGTLIATLIAPSLTRTGLGHPPVLQPEPIEVEVHEVVREPPDKPKALPE